MDLIVYQMMQLQIMHMTDRNRTVKILAGSSVAQSYLTITGDRNTLPELAVISVFVEIIQYLRQKLIAVLLLKFFPFQIDIIICQIQSVHNIILVRTVENRGGNVKAKCLCSKAQVNLKYLSNIHTGRHAQRVQHDIQRTSVRKKRHILHRKHAGNNTLVSVTACHLVADGDLSLLRNIDAHCLVYTRSQLIAGFSRKYLRIHDNTVLAVRYFQRSITHLARLFAEDRTQQTLLSRQLSLALRRYLTDQDIARTHLCTDTDNTPLVEILQRIVADARNVSGDLLRTKLCISCLRLIFFNMNGSINIIHNQTLA